MLWKGATLKQFVKNCNLWEELVLKKFMQGCLSWDRPHPGAGEGYEESFPVEEGVAEIVCDELTSAPISYSPVADKVWSEIQLPGKKTGLGGRCFKIWFYFVFSYSDLLGNKSVNFPELNLFWLWQYDLSLSLPQFMSLLMYFFCPVQLWQEYRAALLGIWYQLTTDGIIYKNLRQVEQSWERASGRAWPALRPPWHEKSLTKAGWRRAEDEGALLGSNAFLFFCWSSKMKWFIPQSVMCQRGNGSAWLGQKCRLGRHS